MGRLKVTQLRSKVGGRPEHRETLRSLGLKRIGDVVVKKIVQRFAEWLKPFVISFLSRRSNK